MAQAGARFANSLLLALKGEKGIVEPTFVYNKDGPAEYFATNVELGKNGVEKIHTVGNLSAHESKLMTAAVDELNKNIKKGVEFVKNAAK